MKHKGREVGLLWLLCQEAFGICSVLNTKPREKKKKKTYVHLKGLGQFRLGKRHPKAKHMQPERTFGDK